MNYFTDMQFLLNFISVYSKTSDIDSNCHFTLFGTFVSFDRIELNIREWVIGSSSDQKICNHTRFNSLYKLVFLLIFIKLINSYILFNIFKYI